MNYIFNRELIGSHFANLICASKKQKFESVCCEGSRNEKV